MKDSELRGLVLQKFYEGRNDSHYVAVYPAESNNSATDQELFRICQQLEEFGLIEWLGPQTADGIKGQLGRITGPGSDVVEGTASAPISVTFDHSQNVTITGSNNIIGDNNYLSLERVNSEINQSNFPNLEKEEAKSLWQKVCENKLLNTVLGAAVSAATKHTLESHR